MAKGKHGKGGKRSVKGAYPESGTANPQLWLLNAIGGGQAAATAAGISINPTSAMRCAAVYACVRVVSEDVAKLPLIIYRRRDDGTKTPAIEHPLYRVLRRRPNDWQSSFEWREMMQAHLELRGNAYSYIVRDGRGNVTALWPLHPDRVSLQLAPDGEVFYRISRGANEPDVPMTVPREAVLHLRGMTLDGYHGLGPIAWARETIGLSIAAELHGAAYFGNGARPDIALTSSDGVNLEQVKKIRDWWSENHAGPGRAHRPAVLLPGMTIEKLGITNKDSQFLELRQFQVSDVARLFRIPPHKIGDLSRATFCLPADALVFSADGPKRIADVRAGDAVWSRDSAGTWVSSLVERSECTGIDRIRRIRTENRTLRLNAKHRVLARRKHSAPRPGPGGHRGIEWRTEWMPAGDLSVGDLVVTLGRLPDVGRREAPNGRVLTPGFMAFCGLLLGDGNVFGNGIIGIARGQGVEYMDYYREVILAEFHKGGDCTRAGERHPSARLSREDVADIRAALEVGQSSASIARRYAVCASTIGAIKRGRNWADPDGFVRPTAKVSLREVERQTRFRSAAASRELLDLGFGGNARTKAVPAWVFQLADDLKLAFIAGFLDADGSVCKLGRMAFHSVNRRMLEQIRHLCMGLGIPVTNMRQAEVRTTLPTGAKFVGEICAFTCSDPGQNRRVPTATPEYVRRMATAQPFGRKGRAYPQRGGAGFAEEGCQLARIVAIDEEPAERVYDLCVTDTHNFIADGVVVHNSNVESMALDYFRDGLMPRLERFEAAMERDLLTSNETGEFEIEFDFTRMLRGDLKAMMEAIGSGRNWGIISANEARNWLNLPPRDGGDTYLEPVNTMPAGAQQELLDQQREADPPQVSAEPDDDDAAEARSGGALTRLPPSRMN